MHTEAIHRKRMLEKKPASCATFVCYNALISNPIKI